MYCTNCGHSLNSDDRYCTNCGQERQGETQTSFRSETKSNHKQADLSLVLGILSLVFLGTPIFAIPLAIASIVTSKHQKSKNIGRILGIVSLVGTFLIILFQILVYFFAGYVWEDWIKEEFILTDPYSNEETSTKSFDIKGYSWNVDDNSILYLNQDETYEWYQSDQNHDNNYYQGKYIYYTGEEAIYYIATHLSEFGITEEEQYSLFQDSTYQLKDYYVMILSIDKTVMEGDTTTPTQNYFYYYGFYNEQNQILNMINMTTDTSTTFTLKERLTKIDI